MMEITHGHLLACPCGGGKPDEIAFLGEPFHSVTCAACGWGWGGITATDAVNLWNGAVRAQLARAVA